MIINDNSDILLTFSWGNFTHGVSGHLFECIEYYYILKNHFNVKILIPENIKNYKEIIESKYDFEKDEIRDILSNTIFSVKPTLVKTNNIFFVDGSWKNIKRSNILYKKILCFACGDFSILEQDEATVLLDYRVYNKVPPKSFNYKKKLLLKKLKKPVKSENRVLIYATENCRDTDYDTENSLKVKKEDLPILNIFEKFNKYVYTPVSRKFDCSPRFLVECKYFNKEIEFYNIDYWKEDRGLYYRWKDIEEDFDSLILEEEDEIIDILKSIIFPIQ